MDFTFENQGTNTYLVYTVKPEDEIDTMSLGMLTNNKICGLASTVYMQMDNTRYIKYNVSAHISAKQFFSGSVNKNRLIGVFKGIVNAMLSAEDYMIDTDSILLDLDYIFADVSTCETVLICLPIREVEQEHIDLGAFFKNIVFSTQFDQTENCDYVAKIINYLNSTPMFSLMDFKAVLNDIDNLNNVHTPAQPVQNVKPVVTVQRQVTVSAQPQVNTKPANTVPEIKNTTVIPQIPTPTKNESTPKVSKKKETVTMPGENAVPFQVPGGSSVPFQVPGGNSVPKTKSNSKPVENGTEKEKKMSMFYLLQHYNKENAAAYKAQKEAKKRNKVSNNTSVTSNAFKVPGAPSETTSATNGSFVVPGQQQVVQPAVNSTPQPVYTKPDFKEEATVINNIQPPQPASESFAMNFGETTVLSGGMMGETTVLGASNANVQAKPYLIRMKNNERINLDKPVFRIGKERSFVDYFIGDNSAISRSHANIINRDGNYFVVDTNSTNHTYVNGSMISSNVEVAITHGATIKLANEEFEFRMN